MLSNCSSQVEQFRHLLHLCHGVPQKKSGYKGRRVWVSDEDLAAHLNGDISFAFCVSTRLKSGLATLARFVAIDIDKQFRERLVVFNAALAALGIAEAAFATGAPNSERGKVIVTFAKLVPRDEAHALSHVIYDAAHSIDPSLVPSKEATGDIELFPKKPATLLQDGGVVRILGRNKARNGPLEDALNLDRDPIEITALKPLASSKVTKLAKPYIVRRLRSVHPKWVRTLTGQAWTWTCFGAVKGMRQKMYALAAYFLSAKGPEAGQAAYIQALHKIRDKSPDLDQPSPKYKDPRNPLTREIVELSAWDAALAKQSWRPIDLSLSITSPGLLANSNGQLFVPRVPESAKRVYKALVEHIGRHGLRPHCFGIDLRTLAGYLGSNNAGVNKNAARDALDLAERHHLVVALHPGTSNAWLEAPGNGQENPQSRSFVAGVPGMYGLVGSGETVFDVLADARLDPLLALQREQHPVQSIEPATFYVVSYLIEMNRWGCIPYPQTLAAA